jgi:hypothetical protein
MVSPFGRIHPVGGAGAHAAPSVRVVTRTIALKISWAPEMLSIVKK